MALFKRVVVVSGWTLGSRLLGLIRDRLLGAAFGASVTLDAFMLAFSLPNLFRNLFGEGALAAAFVPRYVQLRKDDAEQADRFAGLVLTRLAFLLSLIGAIGMVVAWWVMTGYQPAVDSEATAESGADFALVAALALPQIPYLVLVCGAAIMAGVLHGRRHFAVPAASPVVLNLCLIGCVWYWQDVHALPWAVLVTGLLQVGLHGIALRASGRVPAPSVRSTPELRELRRSLVPTLIASGAHQVNALLDSLIAFALLWQAPGAVTILYFGNRLLQFPMALVAHGVGTAVYPDLSEDAREGYATSGATLCRGLSLLLLLLLPAAVGLALVAEPLVHVVYQTGLFDETAAGRVVTVTVIYAVALVPISLSKLFVKLFHAHRDQKTPMIITLVMVALNLSLNLIFVFTTDLMEAGLALATVVSAGIACLWQAAVLSKRGVVGLWRALVPIRAVIASAIMGGGVYAWLTWQGSAEDVVGAGWRLAVAVAGGGILYLLAVGPRRLLAVINR